MGFTIDEQLPRISGGVGTADARVIYNEGLLSKHEHEAQMLILLHNFRNAKPVAKDEKGAIYFEVEDGTTVASKLNGRVDVYKIDSSKNPYFHNVDLSGLRLACQQAIIRFANGELKPGGKVDGLAGFYLV